MDLKNKETEREKLFQAKYLLEKVIPYLERHWQSSAAGFGDTALKLKKQIEELIARIY